MKSLDMLHKGDFNDMSQEWQPDGSVIITLHKRKGNVHRRFRVRNLYKPDEQEVNIDTGKPIAKRDLHKAVPKVPGKAKRPSKRQGS